MRLTLARISHKEEHCVAHCWRAGRSRALSEALLRLSPDLWSGWRQAELRSAESLPPAAQALLAREAAGDAGPSTRPGDAALGEAPLRLSPAAQALLVR